MNKYGAKKILDKTHGKFDSKSEFERFKTLTLLQRCGDIAELRRQVVYVLADSIKLNGRKKPALRYVADFVYKQAGADVVEDVKGFVPSAFRVKQHLMKSVHGIDVIVVKS